MKNIFLLVTGTSSSKEVTQDVQEAVDKNVNGIQKFWNAINWNEVVAVVITKAVTILLLTLLFFILYKIGRKIINKTYLAYGKKNGVNENRANTLQKLIDSVFQYSMIFVFLYTILWVIGVPVGSLITGAGIAGLAIGLGAQGFMNDLITGFFMIAEQQLDVGDHIRLPNQNVDGIVLQVGIRTTKLKGMDGSIHFIPNRNITMLTNLSRSDIRVVIDTRILPEEGVESITELITQATEKLSKIHEKSLSSTPTVFGMVDLGNGNYAIRVIAYAKNGEQFRMNEAFTTEYVRVMTENNFSIPNNPVNMNSKS